MLEILQSSHLFDERQFLFTAGRSWSYNWARHKNGQIISEIASIAPLIKNVLYLKKCSFFRNKSWFVLERVTFLSLFWYWTWIQTKKRTLFLRVYLYLKCMEARNMKSLEKWIFWSWNIRIKKNETCENKIKWVIKMGYFTDNKCLQVYRMFHLKLEMGLDSWSQISLIIMYTVNIFSINFPLQNPVETFFTSF
jgi:hypothetical protein